MSDKLQFVVILSSVRGVNTMLTYVGSIPTDPC